MDSGNGPFAVLAAAGAETSSDGAPLETAGADSTGGGAVIWPAAGDGDP